MIILHFHLQPQFKYELFYIFFTSFANTVHKMEQQRLHEVIQNILDEPIPEGVKQRLLKPLRPSQGGNKPIAPLRRRREIRWRALLEVNTAFYIRYHYAYVIVNTEDGWADRSTQVARELAKSYFKLTTAPNKVPKTSLDKLDRLKGISIRGNSYQICLASESMSLSARKTMKFCGISEGILQIS